MNSHPEPTYKPQIDVECLELYRKGGYHPIAIDDEIQNGRYRIVHKLGYGSYSTVWLARDQKQNRFVAVKILIADALQNSEVEVLWWLDNQLNERSFWGLLRPSPIQHPGRQFLLKLLDEFELTGPNGSHKCLVTEVAGPSVSVVKYFSKQGHLPLDIARKIATQCVKGLACLHASGIVHGDLHTSNILFCLPDIDSWTAEQLYSNFGEPIKTAVTRTDGRPPGPFAPDYVVRSPVIRKLREICLNSTEACSIRIVDFGEAFIAGKQSIVKNLNTAPGIAAPEILFHEPVGTAADIWALACTLFEILSNHHLFESFFNSQDEIVVEIVRTLGMLPEGYWHKWEARKKYFNEDGSFKDEEESGSEESSTIDLKERVQDLVGGSKTAERVSWLDSKELAALENVLQKMLRYAPEERISAEKVLQLLPDVWQRL